MKNKLKFLGLLPLLLLAGCGETPVTSSSLPPASEESSEAPSSTLPPSSSSTSYTSTNEFTYDCSYSGALVDIAVGANLAVGNSYTFGFNFSDTSLTGSYCLLSDDSIATLEENGAGNWTINCLKEGNVILWIYDAEDITHLRFVVRVREAMDLEETLNFLVATDHFTSWPGFSDPMTLTFLSSTTGNLSGRDEGAAINITFTYEHGTYTVPQTGYNAGATYQDNADEYFFVISDFENTATTLDVCGFYVGKTGDFIHPMTNNGVVNVFTPSEN